MEMKTKWKSLSRLFPLGWPWENELTLSAAAIGASALMALCLFAYRFGKAVDSLYDNFYRREPVLVPGRLMPSYPQVLGNSLFLFWLSALCFILLSIAHFLWHRWGSRSDYLMRRLPRQSELWKRCLAGSALLVTCTVLAAGVLFVLFFIWYYALTPAGHLPPDLWAGIGG